MELSEGIAKVLLRGRIVRGLLIALIVLNGLSVVTGVAQLHLLRRASAGVEISDAQATINDLLYGAVGLGQAAAALCCAVFWLMWMNRAYNNLRLMGSGQTNSTPAWAVGYWFVPILSLWKPYQITCELWERSETGNLREGCRPPWLLAWWLVWLTDNSVSQGYLRLSLRAETLPELITMTWVGLVSDVISTVAAVLACLVVRSIDGLQKRAFERIAATPQLPASAGYPTA